MAGAVPPSEYRVRCLTPLTKSGGDEVLRLAIYDREVGVKLRISQINRQMVEALPDRALDLLELAALVYGVDSSVRRGGTVDQQMGRKWHRRFVVEMPVRDLEFWTSQRVTQSLEETLMFLSGDRFEFRFIPKSDPDAERSRFFHFDMKSAWQADRVLMFSGGLDSFAGAVEEIADHHQRVALVSHFSASKIAPIQRDLHKALSKKYGKDLCRHLPMQVQMVGSDQKEGTHRSRSFLFAVLGAITAQAFKKDRVSFYENGVVSLNLPPVGSVVGTRATRTTHPQTLTRFTDFLSKVFEGGMRIDNPFFWRTKTEVVQTVSRLGMSDQIAHTRSCADLHNQTHQYVHCGRCSQCIDRRFAILAAGLAHHDPEEAYKVDLLEGVRMSGTDREIALSYVRNAQVFEHLPAQILERSLPAVLDAVSNLDHPPETALTMIADLLRRHGTSITDVMRDTLRTRPAGTFPDESLLRLYGDIQHETVVPVSVVASPVENTVKTEKTVLLEIDDVGEIVILNKTVNFEKTATAELLIVLAKNWLKGAGDGLDPLDFPFIQANKLTSMLDLRSDEVLRKRVGRARTHLRQRFASAGLGKEIGSNMIENIPWEGYRLAPELVKVRMRKEH